VRALAESRTSAVNMTGAGWRMRLCFTAGAALPRESFDAFAARFGVPVRQLYGCSEAGSVTVNLDPDPVATAATVGRPMRDVRLTVRGPDGAPAPPGTTGEVSFTSPTLAAGYLGAPSESSSRFSDGWFTPGDLGHLDDEGRLTITGRTTLFISTGGYKVDPVEVEDVLRRHPAVADVVVVGAPGPLGGELVKAVVVVAGSPDEADLRRELVGLCGEHLAVHKVPRVVEFLPELPRSPLGKLLRKDLVSRGSPGG
jgi:long-chain acyl-CoA synthetase